LRNIAIEKTDSRLNLYSWDNFSKNQVSFYFS